MKNNSYKYKFLSIILRFMTGINLIEIITKSVWEFEQKKHQFVIRCVLQETEDLFNKLRHVKKNNRVFTDAFWVTNFLFLISCTDLFEVSYKSHQDKN